MNIQTRLNKLEESFTDEQINDIIVARHLYNQTKHRISFTKIVEYTKEHYPDVPPALLTAKLSGRLLDAELQHQKRERDKLNWSKETAERDARRIIGELQTKMALNTILELMQESEIFGNKINFERLRNEYNA